MEIQSSSTFFSIKIDCSCVFGVAKAAVRMIYRDLTPHNTRRRLSELKLKSPLIQCRLFDVMVEIVHILWC